MVTLPSTTAVDEDDTFHFLGEQRDYESCRRVGGILVSGTLLARLLCAVCTGMITADHPN